MNKKPSPLHRASEWIVDHYRLFFIVFAVLLVFSAVASGWVKVENDVAAYLPADSEVRQGLDIMEQEFQTYGSAKFSCETRTRTLPRPWQSRSVRSTGWTAARTR